MAELMRNLLIMAALDILKLEHKISEYEERLGIPAKNRYSVTAEKVGA